MRVLLPLLLIVVLSGCGSPEPVAEPVAEKAIDPQPVAPKAEAQPAAAQPENPKNNPAPDTVAPQQAPAKPPANPQPAQPPVAEKPQQPVAPNRAPGKVPLLVSVRGKTGKKHVGELIERTDAGLVVYDIVLRDTVSIAADQVQSFVEGIDERTASSHVPFATYAAWKLTKLLRIGTIQGQIALASDQGIFINLGSEHGLVAGQSVTLTGKAEVIKDPESGEELAVYRPPLAQLKILAVVNERLSKLSITASDKPVTIERGMTVTCDRGTTTIVVLPPRWKSENPNLKTGDEALYLTEHVLAELVRFGVPVISRDQVDQVTVELSQKTGKPAAAIPAATIGQSLKAGVLVTGQILAKGQIGNVTLHVTNLSNRQYVGIVVGKIRRDKIREASEKAKKAAAKIKLQVGSLPAVMERRKKIATQLIEAGCEVGLKLANGRRVTYRDKKPLLSEVPLPKVFGFQEIKFFEGTLEFAPLLSGATVKVVSIWVKEIESDDLRVFEKHVHGLREFAIYGRANQQQLRMLPRSIKHLHFSADCEFSAKWLMKNCPMNLNRFTPGGGVRAREIAALHRKLRFRRLSLCPRQLEAGWASALPRELRQLSFLGMNFNADKNLTTLKRALTELRNSPVFASGLEELSISWFPHSEIQSEALLEALFVTPGVKAQSLRRLELAGMKLSPEFLGEFKAAVPNVVVLGQ